GVDGKVEDVQLGLVQLVDHEADDLLALLGDHADAVALAQAAEEVLLGPGELEALLLGLEHLGHVPADHPADVDANLFLLWSVRAHNHSPPPPPPRRAARPPPGGRHAPAIAATEDNRSGPRPLQKGREPRGVVGGGPPGRRQPPTTPRILPVLPPRVKAAD